MRTTAILLGLCFSLGAVPAAGQARPIAPAPSVLFAAAPLGADTASVDRGISWWQGAAIGAGGGAVAGLIFSVLFVAAPRCEDCGQPRADRSEEILAGAVLGAMLGSLLTQD